MTNEQKSPNIYQRLANVRDSVQKIGKNAKNQSWGYVNEEKTMEAINPAMRENGVWVNFGVDADNPEVMITETSNDSVSVATVHYIMEFINIDNPEDKVVSRGIGSGLMKNNAQAHAATASAATYAYRTMITKALSIPTSEKDPEADQHETVVYAGTEEINQLKGSADELCQLVENPDETKAKIDAVIISSLTPNKQLPLDKCNALLRMTKKRIAEETAKQSEVSVN